MPFRLVFSWPEKGNGVSYFVLRALLLPVLILRFSEQLSHRDTWEFLIWAALFLAWIVIWPIALLRRLGRIGLTGAWLLPILLPAAALLIAVLRHWPHGLAVFLVMLTIAASVLPVFLSPQTVAQPQ